MPSTRMLDKTVLPTYDDIIANCGKAKDLIKELNAFLTNECKLSTLIRFPYGNNYGWGIKYSKGSKLICDVFPEKDAFMVMIRDTNKHFEMIKDKVSTYTINYINNKYPCGEGGWIHYLVITPDNLKDVMLIICTKLNI